MSFLTAESKDPFAGSFALSEVQMVLENLSKIIIHSHFYGR